MLEGTSSATISNNIVYGCFGFAFYVKGLENIIEGNLASDIKRLWPPLSGYNDHDVYAFYNTNQPNTYIGNVAVASWAYGYVFKNYAYTPPSILVRYIIASSIFKYVVNIEYVFLFPT